MKNTILLFFCCPFYLFSQVEINNGRVLFVDPAIISETSCVEKIRHTPLYDSRNPILEADLKWEYNIENDPYAAPFSGGVWYDEDKSLFKMWYSAGGKKRNGLITCYATSTDGVNWKKPELDVVKGTNIVDTAEHDCVSVLLDKHETDSSKRYKMFVVEFNTPRSVSIRLKYSHDGIHWSLPVALSGEVYDRCTAYYDPFRENYVLSLKTIGEYRRSRNYLAHKDPVMLVSLAHRTYDKTSDAFIRYWFNAEDDDLRHPQFPEIRPQIYNHEAMPYEGLLLGYFTIWKGPENNVCDKLQIQKLNEVSIGWSKDGFNWIREEKTPFYAVSTIDSAWNRANIQSVNGSPIIVGDSLFFYMSGRYNNPQWDSNFATGVAKLRRDGFVSLRAGEKEGYVITNELVFDGEFLFVNAETKGGLSVELLDESGNVIPGFSKNECVIFKGNSTKTLMSWKNNTSLRSLLGKNIKAKFYLKKGDFYSFWISPWITGESRGYTSGGGPGLNSSGVDTKK